MTRSWQAKKAAEWAKEKATKALDAVKKKAYDGLVALQKKIAAALAKGVQTIVVSLLRWHPPALRCLPA